MAGEGAGRSLKGREGGDGEGRGELAGKKEGGSKSKGTENGNFESDKGIRRGCKARGITRNGGKHNHAIMPNAREECHDVKIGKEKKKSLYRKKNEFFICLSYKLFLLCQGHS